MILQDHINLWSCDHIIIWSFHFMGKKQAEQMTILPSCVIIDIAVEDM